MFPAFACASTSDPVKMVQPSGLFGPGTSCQMLQRYSKMVFLAVALALTADTQEFSAVGAGREADLGEGQKTIRRAIRIKDSELRAKPPINCCEDERIPGFDASPLIVRP